VRLLTGRVNAAAAHDLQAHVSGCASCKQRVEHLNLGDVTLPAWTMPDTGHAGAPRPVIAAAPESKAASTLTPTPSVDAATPIPMHRDTAPPNPKHDSAAPPTSPASFGRYQVRRTLGSGGFGTVFLGQDSQLDRPVAIKVLHAGAGRPQAEADRFLQEARRLARLRHPGIVAVHDVGVQEGQVYLVSDFVDGPDLGHHLREHRLDWPEAARIAAAVADALAHAHARQIVHRDVKPANILLTADREPVLVDFGLALDDVQASSEEKGLVSGTPCYMSPEQAAGSAHRVDGRTDIYSLGVVLYEMLTGRVPFRTNNTMELLQQVRNDEPQPPRQVVGDIPVELERICLKTLAKRQQDRYITAADFADDLRRLLAAVAETSAVLRTPVETALPASSRPDVPSPLSSQRSSQRRIREAERRQVTVLVCGCDLFDSETYLELDAEDQVRLLRTFQETCEQAVRRFEGTVVQCSERGLLVCFGYPVAFEHAARRAVETGLVLLDDLKAVGRQLRGTQPLEVNSWVGIHTGPAVVEAKEDSISMVGEARNVAVRLEDVAVPGRVVCTEATHRLIRGHFECANLGSRKIKGSVQPVEIFQVAGVADTRSPIETASPAEITPLTGRDHEMHLLKDRWEQAAEGMGQVVLLVGEAGLGKSRLVYALKQHVQKLAGETTPTDSSVVEWRCAPHFRNTGLYPVVDFFERFLGFSRDEPLAARFDRLVRHLEEYELAEPDVVPLFADTLSLPTDARFPPLGLSPAREREETFRALRDWLRAHSSRRPVLFILEDLHWADASTLEFLGKFLAEGSHDRILTMLTYRPEFETPWPALAHQTRLALNRLTRRQVGDLMRNQAGRDLPEALVEQVFDRAGGVPLFVEEFTKSVQDLGARTIPATLQDLVMARLDRMDTEREIAQLAAVLGHEFRYELLAAVASMEESALQAELAKLAQAEILYPKGCPPQCSYFFKHALLEDALYNALVKDRRQQFHRRIGEALAGKFPQIAETQPELLGHHFTEAGRTDEAIAYWLKAGQRSQERSAHCEAIGHLTKGLALLETLDESPERDGRELRLLTTLAPAYIAARGYASPEAGPILHRALELCRRIGNEQQLFGIMLGLWEWRLVRGDLGPCMDLAADGMELADRLDDPGMRMEALFMPGATLYYRGRFAEARRCYEKAVSAYDDRDRTKFWTAYTGHNAGVTHRCYLALVLWHLGFPDQALQVDREMLALARTIGHPFSLGHALDFTAFLHYCCRLGDPLQTAAQEETALGMEQGFPLWHALGTIHHGAALLAKGQAEEALPLILKGYGTFRATGAEVRAPSYLCLLGDAYTQAGRYQEAHRAFEEGLAVVEKNDDRCHEAELHRLRGELSLAESPTDIAAAEELYRRAIGTAQHQQSKAWELRAATSLARLLQREGRHHDAHASLAAIYGKYTEGFQTPDLVDAKAVLQAST
jgi:predicted ATPase/serine/threonine protein kinase